VVNALLFLETFRCEYYRIITYRPTIFSRVLSIPRYSRCTTRQAPSLRERQPPSKSPHNQIEDRFKTNITIIQKTHDPRISHVENPGFKGYHSVIPLPDQEKRSPLWRNQTDDKSTHPLSTVNHNSARRTQRAIIGSPSAGPDLPAESRL
jgi:hypothetical protein